MITKHIFACMRGYNAGHLLEIKINAEPRTLLEETVTASVKDRVLMMQKKGKNPAKFDKVNECFTSDFGLYCLIQSDLFTPDYKKNAKFEGISTLLPRDADQATIESIRKQLTDIQKTTIQNTTGTLEKYICDFLEKPLETIAKQNRIMSALWETLPSNLLCNGEQIDEEIDSDQTLFQMELKPKKQYFEELVRLNTLLEKEIFSKNRDQPKTPENTTEELSVDYLIENDYIPATESVVGQREYADKRGNLVIHKTSPEVLDVLTEAKIIAARPGRTQLKTALKIYRLVQDVFPDKKVNAGRGGNTLSLSPFIENGGVCIDKALVLQLALQEAGIASRYVRGRAATCASRHAWVEADLLEKGEYAVVLDPHLDTGTIFVKGQGVGDYFYKYPTSKNGETEKTPYFNVVWRSK